MNLRQQLLRSIAEDGNHLRVIPTVEPVTEQVRGLDERLFELHRKCASGTANADEINELERRCDEMERAMLRTEAR